MDEEQLAIWYPESYGQEQTDVQYAGLTLIEEHT